MKVVLLKMVEMLVHYRQTVLRAKQRFWSDIRQEFFYVVLDADSIEKLIRGENK